MSARSACTLRNRAEGRALAWLAGSFLICPCHLPLTLAAVTIGLGGTAAGAAVSGHPYVAGSIITALWLAATSRGIWYLRRARGAESSHIAGQRLQS